MSTRAIIGCAGWSLSSSVQPHFPAGGSHLQRYAAIFSGVEINSSFYRPHRPDTYARWRDSVPDTFRFSVKLPRTITHHRRLQNADEPVSAFMEQVAHLDEKLGCLLVQLPPSLRFDPATAQRFFRDLRLRTHAAFVCEPRNPTWFVTDAIDMLTQYGVGYVSADPPVVQSVPAGLTGTLYLRLHGSPQIYHSAYSTAYLDQLAADMQPHLFARRRVWCIFDNTASGAAVPNALLLQTRISGG